MDINVPEILASLLDIACCRRRSRRSQHAAAGTVLVGSRIVRAHAARGVHSRPAAT
jgi:hypothetical protein